MAAVVNASKISAELEKEFKKLTLGLRKEYDPDLQVEKIFCDGCLESGTFGSTAFSNHLMSCDGHLKKKARADDDGKEEPNMKRQKKKSAKK